MIEQSTKRNRRKRGDGEGTIYQRSDGLWVGQLMVGFRPDGKPDRRNVSAKTQAECRKKLGELRRRHEQGAIAERSKDRETVAGFLDHWLEARKTAIKPNTLLRYTQLVRLHIVPVLGRQTLSALRPDEVQRLYAVKLDAGLSRRTVRHIHTVLHTAIEAAIKWGYVARNVCDAIEPPKVENQEITPPTPEQTRQLLASAAEAGDRFLAIWTLAVYTGCREGELLGLTWPDVDLEAATLTVNRTLLQSTNGGVPAWGTPKTKRSRRTLTLLPKALAALKMHRQRQLEQRLVLGADYAPYNLVFASGTGTPLMHRNAPRSFKAALVRAGLAPSIRFHDLRHAAATMMLQAGIPLKQVSEWLGHNQISTTADIYGHVLPALNADAAAPLARMIEGA